jgi:hypothetical protein
MLRAKKTNMNTAAKKYIYNNIVHTLNTVIRS